jgi:hypothetical protein
MAQPDFGGGRVDTMDFMEDGREPAQPFGVLAPSSTLPAGHPGAGGARYYTIQRVNGGSGGRENEGGGHKHTLEESDAIKKNSVKRKMMKEEREKKRTEVSICCSLMCYPCSTAAANLLFRLFIFVFVKQNVKQSMGSGLARGNSTSSFPFCISKTLVLKASHADPLLQYVPMFPSYHHYLSPPPHSMTSLHPTPQKLRTGIGFANKPFSFSPPRRPTTNHPLHLRHRKPP